MEKSILLLYAHPAQRYSNVNQPLYEIAKQHDRVTSIDLYAEYPDGHIDVPMEQKRLKEHDIIIMQFPFYWYSTPGILKDWQDLVLQYGFAFGKTGTELKGKLFFCSLSTGGPEKAYTKSGTNRFSVRELLRPLEATAHLCGMPYLPPFILYGALTAHEDGRLEKHIQTWKILLDVLTEKTLDIEKVQTLDSLNQYFDKDAS